MTNTPTPNHTHTHKLTTGLPYHVLTSDNVDVTEGSNANRKNRQTERQTDRQKHVDKLQSKKAVCPNCGTQGRQDKAGQELVIILSLLFWSLQFRSARAFSDPDSCTLQIRRTDGQFDRNLSAVSDTELFQCVHSAAEQIRGVTPNKHFNKNLNSLSPTWFTVNLTVVTPELKP